MTKRILTLLTAAVLMMAVLVPAALAEEVAEENEYYVYTENGRPLNVRSEPNGEIVGSLPYGTKVRVTSVINDVWQRSPSSTTNRDMESGNGQPTQTAVI